MRAERTHTRNTGQKEKSMPNPRQRRVAFGCDHRGAALREAVFKELERHGMLEIAVSYGATTTLEEVDYTAPALEVCELIRGGNADVGILVCGSGVGMDMTANRAGTRAALCRSEHDARLARAHNNADVLCLGADVTAPRLAAAIIGVFLSTPFDNDPGHARRIVILDEMDVIERLAGT